MRLLLQIPACMQNSMVEGRPSWSEAREMTGMLTLYWSRSLEGVMRRDLDSLSKGLDCKVSLRERWPTIGGAAVPLLPGCLCRSRTPRRYSTSAPFCRKGGMKGCPSPRGRCGCSSAWAMSS